MLIQDLSTSWQDTRFLVPHMGVVVPAQPNSSSPKGSWAHSMLHTLECAVAEKFQNMPTSQTWESKRPTENQRRRDSSLFWLLEHYPKRGHAKTRPCHCSLPFSLFFPPGSSTPVSAGVQEQAQCGWAHPSPHSWALLHPGQTTWGQGGQLALASGKHQAFHVTASCFLWALRNRATFSSPAPQAAPQS